MTITLSTRSQFAIATTYGPSVNMTAISNAAEAVATLAAGHAVVVGDILEVTSGWGLLSERLVRVKTVATNDITFEKIDTQDVTKFPAGSGIGSIRRITAWTPFTQVQGVQTQKGALEFADTTTMDDNVRKQKPTVRGASSLTLTIFDDPSLAWYAPAVAAADSSLATGLRVVYPNNSKQYSNGYFSVQETPDMQPNAPLTVDVDFNNAARSTRYAS